MKHNRLVICVALVLTILGWSIAAVLMRGGIDALPPSINQQRADLQLTADDATLESMPADMAVMYAGLGSFRGLVVNVLWYRANKLKEEGKHYEAMQLARLITRLQPHFASVWVFHGWNMAYNLSVTARTEQERWMWVRAGVDLLRDEGIPANPNNVALYKELAWFFIHKIGGFTDDMHWYYKRQLAREWEQILGRPPMEDVEAYLDWFRPIAEMDQRFINTNRLGPEARDRLEAMIQRWPEINFQLRVLRDLPPAQVRRRLQPLIDEYTGNRTELAEDLTALRDLAQREPVDTAATPEQRFLRAHPEAEARVKQLRDLGFDLDAELLRQIGIQQTLLRARQSGYAVQPPDSAAEREIAQALREWLSAEDAQVARVRDEQLLPFLRALVLRREYNMSPTFMWELVQGRWLRVPEQNRYIDRADDPYPLPLDWRHPASHALYWASLGVRRSLVARMNRDESYITVLNTDRTVLHALQMMLQAGRITHDPVLNYYSVMPFPYFGEAYERAFVNTYSRIDFEQMARDTPDAPKSFQAGHENLMISIIEQQYFYGSEAEARRTYRRLARLYGQLNNREARYTQPLEQFVAQRLREDISSPDDARQAVAGWIYQAIDQGLANRRAEIARQRLDLARTVYRDYQAEHDYTIHNVERHRMQFLPFGQIEADVFTEYLTSPRVSIVNRHRVWRTMIGGGESGLLELARRIYDRIEPTLRQNLSPENVRNLFPPPSGMAEWREAHSDESPTE